MERRTLLFTATVLAAATVLSASERAWAIRPDLDGERGIEAQLAFGVAGFANTHQRVISPESMPAGPSAPSILGPGFNFRASVGYRFIPAFSAGATFTISPLGASALQGAPNMYNYSASTYAVGAYGRLYFLAPVGSIPRTARVEFSSWGDLRRLDPWISLGVEYQSFTYAQVNSGDARLSATFTRGAVSIPFGLGFEFRLLPMLAVGAGAHFGTVVGASTSKVTSSVNRVTSALEEVREGYSAADPVNLFWSAGLTARYTLTL